MKVVEFLYFNSDDLGFHLFRVRLTRAAATLAEEMQVWSLDPEFDYPKGEV